MAESEGIELQFLIGGILGMFGLAVAIIGFVVLYQRKLLSQQKKIEEERSQYQEELLQSVLDAQEAERERIGRDLHDDIGSMLATARLYIQQTQQKASEKETEWMDKADEVLSESIKSLGIIARDLVPTVLNQLGLPEAIEGLCDVVRKNAGHKVTFGYGNLSEMPPEQALHIYRITQELITNTLKHADADLIQISLGSSEVGLHLIYIDNGVGMKLTDNSKESGLGIKNIESRLSLLKGSLKIQHPEEGGVVFKIGIPQLTK
ncbi:MAG: histidine kinase [Bacteroidia bacterium]|nr:histidine kinase [Bacteroidia bacterium]